MAGGALYVVYDSGLLGSSEQGTEVLGKAKSAVPPAINEWLKYFGMEVATHHISPGNPIHLIELKRSF